MTEAKINTAETAIFEIIKADVCGMCNATESECLRYRLDHCYAGYERQAREIYRLVVQPLEEQGRE